MPDLLAESPFGVAEVLLSRAAAALAADPTSETIADGNAFVFAGDLAWDECCGVLAATAVRTFRTVSFPTPVSVVTNCNESELCVDIVVILLRCMPVITENGEIPTSQEVEAASLIVGHDAAVIANAIVDGLPDGWESANFEQTFAGAQGGCIAVDTRLTIGLPQSYWCPPVEVEP